MGDSGREIEKLIFAYAEYLDSGDLARVADLFAHGRIQAAPGVVHEGATQVRAMYDDAVRLHADGTPRTKHLITNVAVDIGDDGQTAKACSSYTVQQMPMTEAAIHSGLTRDLYVSLGEALDEKTWTVRVYVKPFVDWIWGGALLMALGGLLALADRRYRVAVRDDEPALQAAVATAPAGLAPVATSGAAS